MTKRVYIYDTTLRDGAQTEGISFSVADKKAVFGELSRFGMDFIETGMPASNPKDEEFTVWAAKEDSGRAVAFGSTCKPGKPAEKDPGLRKLLACGTDRVCIFGKSWDFHVEDALKTTLEENLRMVSDSIAYLRSQGCEVMFDAEHFFDGYAANPEYAISVLNAAVEAGVAWIVLCDTNGGALPDDVTKATKDVVSRFGKKAGVGIHCHNDSDLGVACSLAAVEAGATMVQGTVNGIGERCGNANLCSIMPALALKMGYSLPGIDMASLTRMSRFVSESANIRHQAHMPYVGDKAFAHKGGMHVSAVMKDSRTYEHVSPESVGNVRRVLVSDMAGRATIAGKLEEMGVDATADAKAITEKVKEMEALGYQFEGADASFRLMVERMEKGYMRPFEITGFRLYMDEFSGSGIKSEASIKVRNPGGEEEHTASEGNGPVNALDNALRKALSKFYPILTKIRLTDYKVRVLDEKAATAAAVRVHITSTDGEAVWTTVGVSDNVIEASLIALSDSIEYALASSGRK